VGNFDERQWGISVSAISDDGEPVGQHDPAPLAAGPVGGPGGGDVCPKFALGQAVENGQTGQVRRHDLVAGRSGGDWQSGQHGQLIARRERSPAALRSAA